jgi:predicted nucleic acid-binding protein
VTVFVDTSALYALLNVADPNHVAASSAWDVLRKQRDTLVTSNYVLVETTALVQRRMGIQALRNVQTAFLPLLSVVWIDEALHARALSVLLALAMRELSLVDCTSFEVMRSTGTSTAFAFDAHFTRQGFRTIPTPTASEQGSLG